jgi:hypothetical protein
MLRPLAVAVTLVVAATAARAANVGDKCRDDDQCPLGSICSNASICTALPRTRHIIPFYFHQPGDSGYRHITPLLYFHSWDKHRDTRVQVPLFGYRHDRDRDESTTVVPLLFSSFHQSPAGSEFRIWPFVFMAKYKDGGGQAAMLPLFWWQKHEGRSWFVAPLLLSGGQRDDRKDITEAVLGLVGYYRRHGDFDTWRILFPLLFEHETREARTFVGPFMWFRNTREGHNATVIFPLIWHAHDEKSGYDHTLALPLFDLESERHGRKQRLVSILGAYERDDDIGLRQYLVYAPLVFHRTDQKRTVTVVPPLVSYWSTRDDGSRGLIAGPVIHASDPTGSTTALFPIYWRFHDRARHATTQVLFPIAAYHKHDGAAGGFVGPFYGWSSTNSGDWGAGLAPLLFFGKSGATKHAIVLPLFGRVWNDRAGTDAFVAGPIFHRSGPDVNESAVFPLAFFGRRGALRYGVFGPAYGFRDGSGWAGGLAPLFFFGNRDGRAHQVVFPLFWHFSDAAARSDRLVVGPYIHRRDGDETADALFPLFYLRRSPTSGFGLWPIGAWQRKDGVDTTVVGPFVHQSNARRHSRTNIFFPLLTLHDEPRWSVRVFFPFVWRVRDGNETDTAIFPFYFRGRAPDHGWDGVFPLFVHSYDKTVATTVLGPIWWRTRTDGGRSGGLFPLAAYGKKVGAGGKSVSWFGMPGVFADKNEFVGTSHTWVGNFFHFTQPDGYSTGFIPIAFAWRRGTVSKVLTPIYYRQADRARDYALDVFTLLYFGHEGRDHQFGIFPLFMAATHADGTWRAGVFPLFYGAKRNDGSTLATLLGGWSSYAGGKRLWVGPFYYRNDATTHSGAFFPIVYHGQNQLTGARTTLAVPLLLDTRNGEGRELQAYTPLTWRYHSIESTTVVGLPLFFDVNRFHESRTTALFPFFMRNRSNVNRDTSWTFPPLLTWFRTRDDGSKSDAVVFPIVWHFGGKDSTTVVFPLGWDFKRGESRTTVFAPFGAHWSGHEREHTLVLNVYYGKGRGATAGSWMLDVFPFIRVGRARKQDIEWYVLEGLFGYSRLGRNRNLRLLWVLDFKLEPVPASNLSWFGSTAPSARELF